MRDFSIDPGHWMCFSSYIPFLVVGMIPYENCLPITDTSRLPLTNSVIKNIENRLMMVCSPRSKKYSSLVNPTLLRIHSTCYLISEQSRKRNTEILERNYTQFILDDSDRTVSRWKLISTQVFSLYSGAEPERSPLIHTDSLNAKLNWDLSIFGFHFGKKKNE